MNGKYIFNEKLVIGICFLVVALGIAVAVPLIVDHSVRRMLLEAAFIVLALSVGVSLLGSLDWLVSPRPPASVANELDKFAQLRDRGILTEEEFQSQKRRLLRPSAGDRFDG